MVINLIALLAGLAVLVYSADKFVLGGEIAAEQPVNLSSKKAWLYFLLESVGLLWGSRMRVMSAVSIARFFNASDVISVLKKSVI